MSVVLDIPRIETDRLVLREPRLDDFRIWHAFAQTERARYIGGPIPDEGKSWRAYAHVAGLWMLRGYSSFVFTLKGDDTALGMTGPWHPIDWPEKELGWTVWADAAEGKGYAFEAAMAARRYAYEVLDWDTAVSYIDPENARSIALAERMGAVRDDTAKRPHPEDLVYRHPAPEALQ